MDLIEEPVHLIEVVVLFDTAVVEAAVVVPEVAELVEVDLTAFPPFAKRVLFDLNSLEDLTVAVVDQR